MRKHQKGISTTLIIALLAILMIVSAALYSPVSNYLRRSKTTEATMNVRKLFDSSVSYYEDEHKDKDGNVLPRQFPESVGFIPAQMACDGDSPRAHKSTREMWNHPTWRALNFGIGEGQEFYYSYRYESSGIGEGSSAKILAQGDLDCDGKLEYFDRSAVVENNSINRGYYHENELE